jgi:3-phosphoshikimate 1-carboxyvinyltransferase
VSHRALLIGALGDGDCRVDGLLESEDVAATMAVVRQLGASVEREGRGFRLTPGELTEPRTVLDCGNSGTTMRLTCGWLAAEPVHAVLAGDASLSRRPMKRVSEPLRSLGVQIDGREGGRLAPLAIRGGGIVRGARFDLPIASAQVKSALLLAGRHVGIAVREPRQSRDHTERLLRAMGASLEMDAEGYLNLAPVGALRAVDIRVPADLSAAAFWLVAGAVVPGSEIHMAGVGINPSRAGVLDALSQMQADVEIRPVDGTGPEPIADLVVRHGRLRGTEISGDLALRCLDELPVLAVAAAFADGQTVIRDAAELRVKESDRIARTIAGLRSLCIEVEELPDGMVIQGGTPKGPAAIDAEGDHRIAMAFAIAGQVAQGGLTIQGADSIRSSYPTFFEHLAALKEDPS